MTGELDIKTLENWLWDASCKIRGPVDAPKYKDYILPPKEAVVLLREAEGEQAEAELALNEILNTLELKHGSHPSLLERGKDGKGGK